MLGIFGNFIFRQHLRELFRVAGLQIVWLLSKANELVGQAAFLVESCFARLIKSEDRKC